ncbi:MAG: type I methionyl aminopeptidase [Gammaproteobacteria bacterium]|nr:type I methionyl aminopeptidase [Gammaproteobacteria bacterium]
MEDKELCWCGSNKEYKDCHKEFDLKLLFKKKEGYKVPPRSFIKNAEQIEGIKKAAVFNNGLLDLIENNIKEGMSTEDIEQLCIKFLDDNNCKSADFNYEGYPKHICTSINDVVCHGIPSAKDVLKKGDIINVDSTLSYNGYFADASRMFEIGNVSEKAHKLVYVTKECLNKAIETIKPWESTLNDIGIAIEKYAHKRGFTVVEEFCGHGVGLEMHEDPYVLHYSIKEPTYLIVPGMVFTIEPMINEGRRFIEIDRKDGWTVRTSDHKLSAQWEHTLIVTEDGVEIVSF